MCINLKKRVKAGVMLYALLMVAVFSLLLQFYLHCQLSESRIALANHEGAKAYLMAELTMDNIRHQLLEEQKEPKPAGEEKQEKDTSAKAEAKEQTAENVEEEKPKKAKKSSPAQSSHQEGEYTFSQGKARYVCQQQLVEITVWVTEGREYRYQFSLSSENP